MELDSRQTRRLFLTGTVAFPLPFPSTGTISFEACKLTYASGEPSKAKDLIVVQESSHSNRAMARAILRKHVAAIFIPGLRGPNNEFQISQQPSVNDFEQGAWFVDSDVSAEKVRAGLNRSDNDDISTRGSILRGIVFAAKDAPVLSVLEVTETAAATRDVAWPTMLHATVPVMRRTADGGTHTATDCLCIGCRG